MIRLGYVEFEPIFEIVSFPDELWSEMDESGLLKMIRTQNWSAPEHSLPDFWVNFEYLHRCYEATRNGAPLPNQISVGQSPSQRLGKWWQATTGQSK
jgi:hypothetical protein